MYRPLRHRYLDAFLTLDPIAAIASEHDKVIVGDRRAALIGGRNISHEYFAHPADVPKVFRDADLLLESPAAAAALTTTFEAQYESSAAVAVEPERWVSLHESLVELETARRIMDAWLHGEPIAEADRRFVSDRGLTWIDELEDLPHLHGALRRPPPRTATAPVRLLDSRTRLGEMDDPITVGLERLVAAAKRRIVIVTPYLVLSEAAVEVLADAGRRGVRIDVLTNSPLSSDNALSQAAFLEQWPELLARVPRLRLFVVGDARNLHGKLAVFDDVVGVVGTYNLDPLSMAVNSELVAVAWSRDLAREIAASARERMRAGAPSAYRYRIARDVSGAARRDDGGKPIVAFGPADHLAPEQWQRVQAWRAVLRTARLGPFPF
jgi:phosphatidylserine/phosphatidylglycerophosphate/cardiolipin synthase-like enzyme